MTAPDLDSLLARARRLDVRSDHADDYVRQLGRWSRGVPEPRRRWVPWLIGGLGAAVAVAAILIVVMRGTPVSAVTPVRIGDRVAIVAGPGTSYRVIAADHDRTELDIERGTITARLFPGERKHRLTLHGADVDATASGTIYSLTVDDRGATVAVHEGRVVVRSHGTESVVPAGTTWPVGTADESHDAAVYLLVSAAPRVAELVDPPPAPTAPTQPAPPSAPPHDAGVARSPSPHPGDAGPPPDAPSLSARWRTARLYRSQGRLDDALAECLAIAGAGDATWSPIALLEAARIELGPRSAPERAIELADRFDREWPTHALAAEARELRCRALRQLGRGSECTGH